MIWMTWRQHRAEAIVLVFGVAAVALFFIVTGHIMYADYDRVTNGLSVAICQQQHQQQSDACSALSDAFYNRYFTNTVGLASLLFLPPLIGMFLGAPLVARELERGTFRLAWTQSVTRRRWLLTKTGILAGGTLLISAVLIPLFQWWNLPISFNENIIGSPLLQFSGILPLAYTTFALALGITAGTLLRRTVPAMFATLATYTAVALAFYNWVRPNLPPPLAITWDPYKTDITPSQTSRDWILYNGYIDRAGHHIDFGATLPVCAPNGSTDMRPGSAFNACLHAHGWLSTIVWQPADRFWAFQGIESAVLIALAVALLALTIWLVRRRIA